MRCFFSFLVLCLIISHKPLEAYSPLRFREIPKNQIEWRTDLELRNDVYSNDLIAFLELAPLKNFSVFGEISYRTFSIESQNSVSAQVIHKHVNLDVSGLNASLVGIRFLPFEFLGLNLNWEIPSDNLYSEKFHSISPEIFFLTSFSSRLKFLFGIESKFYIPKSEFQKGNEIGVFLQSHFYLTKWTIDYLLEFQQRIKESRNKRLADIYQKQNDQFSALRFKTGIWRELFKNTLNTDLGLHYEFSQGLLYAKEPSHRLEFSARVLW